MTINLSQLPAPDVIETLDVETIFAAKLERLIALYPEFTALVESDPAYKILEVAAYDELLLRARINDAARSNLLAFAIGSDLDHRGADEGVARMAGEDDDRFRLRIQLRIAARSGCGTPEHYRFIAMTASANVINAEAVQTAHGHVWVAIWSGADDAATLAAVNAALRQDDAVPLGVQVSALLARPWTVNVHARIVREASAPVNLAAMLAARLPGAIAAHAKLGRDITRSWLMSQLHIAGVSRVELDAPTEDATLQYDEYATPGQIHIIDAGVAW